jgi:catechol 2,3-dioxygenase-like lactoylglutathione lyase family enzyme
MQLSGLCPLLQVFDMPASLHFYRHFLDFETVQETPDWVWLKRDNFELMLNTAYESPHRPNEPDPARQAAHADTCLFIGCPDPDAAHAELTAKGLILEPPHTAPYGMRQLNLKDPDGYGLCLQWPVSE